MSEQNREEYPQLKLDSQLCFPLYACARRVIGAYTPLLKPLGLTYTQYLVMMELWETGKEKVGDLCHRLYLDCGTVTPMLKKMEESAGGIRGADRKRLGAAGTGEGHPRPGGKVHHPAAGGSLRAVPPAAQTAGYN